MRQDRSESGAAAVEFALVLPVIVVLCLTVLDFGMAVNLSTELKSAARAGAQYAMSHPSDSAGIAWAAQNATKEPTADLTVTSTTTTPSGSSAYYCTCTDGDPTLSNQINCNTGVCTSGTKRFFVAVSVSKTYSPILPYPGLTSDIPLTGTAIVRVQ